MTSLHVVIGRRLEAGVKFQGKGAPWNVGSKSVGVHAHTTIAIDKTKLKFYYIV